MARARSFFQGSSKNPILIISILFLVFAVVATAFVHGSERKGKQLEHFYDCGTGMCGI